ncbi:hypothetical protein N0V88_003014 [Collariella sp. IMI 366227]|nr:hypothetical protein N0V88_003014 [Collariella sp. IMI 366227]
MSSLPAVRRQHLLAEFAGLKQACPQGIYVSLTPGDPSLWSGVIFVRKGPYTPAILRFQLSFPDTYPSLPPLVTFATDIFHPLIAPLTTYMYSTDVGDGATASAFDEERLPPGEMATTAITPRRAVATATGITPGSAVSAASSSASRPGYGRTEKREVATYDVLRYIRSAFDNEDVLDAVPLEAAGNPGAWHAWRTHRKQVAGKRVVVGGEKEKDGAGVVRQEAGSQTGSKGVAASLSEGVLFGNGGMPDELINFLNMDDPDVDAVKSNLLRTIGATP